MSGREVPQGGGWLLRGTRVHPHVSMDKLITTLCCKVRRQGWFWRQEGTGSEGMSRSITAVEGAPCSPPPSCTASGAHTFFPVLLTPGQPFCIPVLDLPLLAANTTKQTASGRKSPYCPSAGDLLNKLWMQPHNKMRCSTEGKQRRMLRLGRVSRIHC